MLTLEDKGGRPDRNEPDSQVRGGQLCLIYGFTEDMGQAFLLNGLQCYVEEKITRSGNLFFPVNEAWYACSVYGQPRIINIREDHLTVLTDSDTLVIEMMTKDK